MEEMHVEGLLQRHARELADASIGECIQLYSGSMITVVCILAGVL